MLEFPLNQIINSEYGWTSVVFQIGMINAGNIFISEKEFKEMDAIVPGYSFRYYQKTKKITISSSNFVDFKYCALKFNYLNWVCLHCHKISKISDSICFCSTYSKCWTPVDASIVGIEFSNELKFNYHFSDDPLFNIIL